MKKTNGTPEIKMTNPGIQASEMLRKFAIFYALYGVIRVIFGIVMINTAEGLSGLPGAVVILSAVLILYGSAMMFVIRKYPLRRKPKDIFILKSLLIFGMIVPSAILIWLFYEIGTDLFKFCDLTLILSHIIKCFVYAQVLVLMPESQQS